MASEEFKGQAWEKHSMGCANLRHSVSVVGLVIALFTSPLAFAQAAPPVAAIEKAKEQCSSPIYRQKDEGEANCALRLLSIDRSRPPKPLTSAKSWVAVADYPPEALRARKKGVSRLQLNVTSAGKVASCEIVASSGHSELDARACEKATERASFWSAYDRFAQPVAATFEFDVDWRFDGSPQPPVQRGGSISGEDYPPQMAREGKSGQVTAAFIVDENGRATQCQIASSSGHAELDTETCRLIERRFRFTPGTDAMGSFVPVSRVQTVNWALPNIVDPKKDDILAKANDRCVFLGYKPNSRKFINCVEEQLRLLSN